MGVVKIWKGKVCRLCVKILIVSSCTLFLLYEQKIKTNSGEIGRIFCFNLDILGIVFFVCL